MKHGRNVRPKGTHTAVRHAKKTPAVKSRGEKTRNPTKGLASTMLGGIGAAIGGPAGGLIGNAAGHIFSQITGYGDYKVEENSLTTNTGPPIFGSGSNGSCSVKHREYLGDIISSIGFANREYPLNPGLSTTFPWLSTIATHFENYRFKGLVFQFKSTASEVITGTNNAMGAVIAATEYDTFDAGFTSKLEMENHMFAVSCKPSESMLHPVECKPGANVLETYYTRSDAVPTGADQRFYDLGNFQLATVGSQAAATVGELWVTYDVEFSKPHYNLALGAGTRQLHAYFAPTTSSTFGSFNIDAASNIGGAALSTNSLYLPAGRYHAHCWQYATTSLVSSGTPPAFQTGVVGVNTFANHTGSKRRMGNTIELYDALAFDVNTPLGEIYFSPCLTLTGSTSGDLLVYQVSRTFAVPKPMRGLTALVRDELLRLLQQGDLDDLVGVEAPLGGQAAVISTTAASSHSLSRLLGLSSGGSR